MVPSLTFDENFDISIRYLDKIIDHLFNYLKDYEDEGMTKSNFIRQLLFTEKNIKDIIICNLNQTILEIEKQYSAGVQQA